MRLHVVLTLVSVMALTGCTLTRPGDNPPFPPYPLDQIDQQFVQSDFKIVYTREALPEKVLRQIQPIANPAERYNGSDVIDTNLPSRRIVFCGISEQFVFVLCDQGGFVSSRDLQLFPLFENNFTRRRVYSFRSYVSDFSSLKKEIKDGLWADKRDVEKR